MGERQKRNGQKTLIVRILFGIWCIVWLYFTLHPFIFKDRFTAYKSLWGMTNEERKEYLLGPDLYSFFLFCREIIPGPATYQIIGLKEGNIRSLKERQAQYYLYPLYEADNPEYIFVFGRGGVERQGYDFYQSMDTSRYILKRKDI